MVAGASKEMIADRLRHLEHRGLIVREVMNTASVSGLYSMTAQGKSALAALRFWSEKLAEKTDA